MESVWMRWRKKLVAHFHAFRERRALYLTIAVWATLSRNSSRSRGSIRDLARSIHRGRWTMSGRLSTMPCPSCAASRPARRSTSSGRPACAWHLLLQPQYGIADRAAQRPGRVAEGRRRGAAAECTVGIQHRDGIGCKVERPFPAQTDLFIERRNQLCKADRQVGYAAPQVHRLFHQLQDIPNGGVMPRKDVVVWQICFSDLPLP